MNRIYQGRATTAGWAEENLPLPALGVRENCPLWFHHRLFSDAINYYLVALASVAAHSDSRLARDLLRRLEAAWDKFPRPVSTPARSLGESLRETLGLSEGATFADARRATLTGNHASPEILATVAEIVFTKCRGDSGIQQGGRGYYPQLCWRGFSGNFDYSPAAVAAASGKARLAEMLHDDPSAEDLRRLAADMDLSWTVKTRSGEFHEGTAARLRLTDAAEHWLKNLADPTPRLCEYLVGIGDPIAELESLRAHIPDLPDAFRIAKNNKAAKDLTFATILFIAFPNQLTRQLLRLGVKAPGKAKKSAGDSESRFTRFSDAPLKLARGERGFVFPAFTSLPQWHPIDAGEPVWKEFDIAAFKEALKALNQFRLKTEEREAALLDLTRRRDIMLGEAKADPKSETEAGVPVLAGDPRFLLARDLETHLTQQLGLPDPFTVTRASLRGLRDVATIWSRRKKPSKEQLEADLKTWQADPKNKRDVGSIPLMLALCEPQFHDLWHENEEAPDPGRARHMLSAMVDLHQLKRDIKRATEPINLTPAEPVHSRRLFMFSDLTGRSAPKFPSPGEVEVSVANPRDGRLQETRLRIGFSAPRLVRDQLLGGETSRWLQPMTIALGLEPPVGSPAFDSAVALMPAPMVDGSIRHLLNFPVRLEPEWLHHQLGKAARWHRQFNGTKDINLHLHWPSTSDKTGWHRDLGILEKGFRILSVDLGQRTAGAAALISMTPWKPSTNRPIHSLGNDGEREWWAEVEKTIMLRVPGENAKVLREGEFKRELCGAKGRPPSEDETKEARRLAREFGITEPGEWIASEASFPEQNDILIRMANRRLSRLATYHRWSCFDPDTLPSGKRDGAVENLGKELAMYEDPEVKSWAPLLAAGHFADFRHETGRAFSHLRDRLEDSLVTLANRSAPLRKGRWHWRLRSGSKYGELIPVLDPDTTHKIRFQRGLSMARIEQLDRLRRLFLRFNRSLDREPCVRALFGAEDRGRESLEPCGDLLEKLQRMKDERVNQTAHCILALALGVRLKADKKPQNERTKADIHGEYERIPSREPVDFIVMEDLSRYLSSQGRAPSENSRLMKWSHRAVRDKLKMLTEEPFGIPVVEVVPAYSSRFHSINGQPGARVLETPELPGYQRQLLQRLADSPKKSDAARRAAASSLLDQFELLDKANADRLAKKKTRHTLLVPQTGGPLFLAARDGQAIQADLNAAVNLGLRAVAAPDAIHIHRRVRATREGKKNAPVFKPRRDNAREKAAFASSGDIEPKVDWSKETTKSAHPNFFHEPDDLRTPSGESLDDRASLNGHSLVSGLAIWSAVNQLVFTRCANLNEKRLARWGLDDDVP